jgi:hypothetical protein
MDLIQEPKGWMIRFSGQVTEEILVVPQLQRVASSIDCNQMNFGACL